MKYQKGFIVLYVFLFAFFVNAQTISEKADDAYSENRFEDVLVYPQNNCDCENALEKLIIKIESEYPGFQEKTKDTLLYESLKKNLILESKTAKDSLCLDVLKKYTGFFKDGHIWILANDNSPTEAGKGVAAEKVDIDLEDFHRKIKKTDDKLEGIWKDGSYTVGITKTDKNEYTGFIIETDSPNWKPDQVKFKLKRENDVE